METPLEKFEMWARVDLFGHNQRVGKLSVVNTGVEVLYRLDIPNGDTAGTTEFYGKGAVYSIIPVSEDAARLIATKLGPPAPISQWDLPEQWREGIRMAQAKALPETTTAPSPEGNDPYDGSDFEAEDEDEEDSDEDDEPEF